MGDHGALSARRSLTRTTRNVRVTRRSIFDHDWAKSIYFKAPNGIQLEYCCFTRNLNANDARMQDCFEMSVRRLGLEDAGALMSPTSADAGSDLNIDVLVKTPGPSRSRP